jgi:HEAT repeat protein
MRLKRYLLAAGLLAVSAGGFSLYGDEDPAPVVQRAVAVKRKFLPAVGNDPKLANSPDQATVDKKALESIGLKADDTAGILKYLKDRTVNDVDADKINAIIKRFGLEDFEERVKASEEIERFGTTAIGLLKKASQNDTNPPEVIFRAKMALRRMEKISHENITTAAIRALAGVKNKEITPVLLGFLPLADSPQIVDQIHATLIANVEVDGKPDPALFTALKDANPLRRTAAAVALVEGGKFTPEVRSKEITPVIMDVLKSEKDTNFRFAVIRSFLLAGTEKKGVQLLIDLLPDLNRSQIWQAEDFLFQLAGKDAPKARCLKTLDSKNKAKTAWTEWWTKNEKTAKFEPGSVKPRIQGKFNLVTLDYRFGQNGMITEYGPDEKERWRLSGLGMPMDIAFTSNDRIIVADQNQSAIIERDLNGKVLSTKSFQIDNPGGGGKIATQPKGMQVLEKGGLLVFGGNGLIVYDKDGKEVTTYVRPAVVNFGNHDINAACKLKSGEIVVSVMNNGPNGQNPQLIFLDEKGKELKDRAIKTGQGNNYMGSITEFEPNKVLFTEINQLVEIDLKTGKTGWKKTLNQPRSIQRLPNGNTLFVDFNQYPPRIVEQTPEGDEAWAFTMKDQNIQVMKAFIR